MKATDKEARALYESGLSGDEVAEILGYTKSGVLDKVRRAGGTVRPSGRNFKAKGYHTRPGGYVMEIVTEDWPFYTQMARPCGTKKDGKVYSMMVAQHRKVMADHLGRALSPTETVHHINGVKTDNNLENLQLRLGRHGKNECYECQDCKSRNVSAVPI